MVLVVSDHQHPPAERIVEIENSCSRGNLSILSLPHFLITKVQQKLELSLGAETVLSGNYLLANPVLAISDEAQYTSQWLVWLGGGVAVAVSLSLGPRPATVPSYSIIAEIGQ